MATPVATFFAEADAVRVSIAEFPLTGLRVLVRAWQLTEDALREDAPTYLRDIINYTDPQADQEAYTGAWRSVLVTAGKIKDREGMWVIQTLAAPLAGALINFASLRACKAVENTYSVVQWPYIVTAPENPRGGIYTAGGTFNPNDGTYSGSVQYKGFYAKTHSFVREIGPFTVETVMQYDNSWLPIAPPAGWAGPGIYRASNSITEACLYDGTLGYGYSRLNGTFTHASKRGHLSDEDTRVYRQWDVPINAPENPRGTVYSANSSLDNEGFYNGSLSYQQFGAYATRSVRARSPGSVTVGIEYQQWPVIMEALASGAGGIYRASSTLTDAQMYNGDQSYTYSTLDALFSHYSQRGALTNDQRLVYEKWNAIISAPLGPVGTIYSASCSLDGENTYGGSIGYQVLSPYAIVGVRTQSPTQITVGIEYRHWPAHIQAPLAGAGGIYRASSSLGQGHVYDGDLSYTYAALNGLFSHYTDRGFLSNAQRLVYDHWNEIISAPMGPQGTIYSAACSLGDDNTYSGGIGYVYLSPYAISSARSNGALQSSSGIEYQASRSQIVAPSFTAGVLYRADSTLQNGGVYAGSLGYEAFHASAIGTVRSRSPSSITVGIEYQSWPAAIQALETGVGGVYRASSNYTNAGVYNGDLTYQYSTGLGLFWHQRKNTGPERDDALIYNDYPLPTEAPNSPRGAIYSAQTSLNDSGLYNGALDYQRFNSAYFTTAVSRNFTGETTETKYLNALNPVLPPANVPRGGMYRASFMYSDAQVYNGNLTYDNGGTPQEFMFIARQEASIYSASFVYQNQDTKKDAPANGANFVYSANSSLGADGFYQNNVQYQGARSIEDGFTFPTKSGSVYVWKGSDVTEATAAALYTSKAAVYLATAGWDISLDRRRSSQFASLYDYTVTARPSERSAPLGDAWTTGYVYWNFQDSAGATLYVYRRFTTSQNTAENWVNQAPAVSGAVRYSGTGVQATGRGRLIATRVERKT